jgi:tRNA-2-methylthio-N6-dimethylallyladenosine synthase
MRRNSELVGEVQEVLVEGHNHATGQWIGRNSENRVVNFTHAGANGHSLVGEYLNVRVTRAGPNSLAGTSV